MDANEYPRVESLLQAVNRGAQAKRLRAGVHQYVVSRRLESLHARAREEQHSIFGVHEQPVQGGDAPRLCLTQRALQTVSLGSVRAVSQRFFRTLKRSAEP